MTNGNTSNWLAHMYVVQWAINNCPVCSHKNLSPYTMYYTRPNKISYSAIFGKAYKDCKTEFGLRAAKLVLKRLKIGDPAWVLSQDEGRYLIAQGDNLFDQETARGEEFNPGCISELANELLQEMTSTEFCSNQESIDADDLSTVDLADPIEGKKHLVLMLFLVQQNTMCD